MTNNEAFSLLETLIGLAVLGIAAASIMTLVKNATSFQKNTTLQMDLEEIRRYMNENISCEDTLFDKGNLKAACNASGSRLTVFDLSGAPIITQAGTRYGSFVLRAQCENTSSGLQLRIERLHANASGTPAPHPLTGEPGNWQTLFKDRLSPCPATPQPEEVIVKANLDMDFPTKLTVAAFLLGAFEGPVITCGDSEWTDPEWMLETSLLYRGLAQCPRGYSLVGGGVDCSIDPAGEQQLDKLASIPIPAPISGGPHRRKAYKIYNDPIYDETAFNELGLPERKIHTWHGACCIRVNTVPTGSVSLPLFPNLNSLKDRVFARCIKNT